MQDASLWLCESVYWIYLHLYILHEYKFGIITSGNTKGGSITVPLTSLESAVWLLNCFVFICKTDLSKPVKQEVNGTVILPRLVFPDHMNEWHLSFVTINVVKTRKVHHISIGSMGLHFTLSYNNNFSFTGTKSFPQSFQIWEQVFP